MSLINEALKKARLESARKEDRRHGLLAPSHHRPRRSAWPWILTAGSLCLAIGVIVGVVLRSGGEAPAPQAAVTPSQQSASAVPQQSSAPLPQAELQAMAKEASPPRQQPVPIPVVTPEPELGPGSTMVGRESAPTEALPDLTLEGDVAGDMGRSVLPSSQGVTRLEPLPATGPQDGESFLRTVPLPGEKELVLNGIAWSDSGPVALINGRALEKGEYVDGWKLGLIERQQVELLKDEVTIRVRLK